MHEDHRLVQVVSHVTSFVGRIGVIGLCSCGWLAGEEGEDTRLAVLRLNQAWEAHDRGETPAEPGQLAPAAGGVLVAGTFGGFVQAGNCTCSACARSEALSALRMYPEAMALSRLLVYCGDVVALGAVEAGELGRGERDGGPEEGADRVGAGGRCAAEGGHRDVDRRRADASDHVAVRIEGQRRRMRCSTDLKGGGLGRRRAVVDPLVEGGERGLDHVVLGAAVHRRGAAEDARGRADECRRRRGRCRRSPRCGSCRCWAAAPGRTRAGSGRSGSRT